MHVLLTIGIMAIFMGLMAIGLVRGRRLKGSCGGAGGPCHCEATGVPLAERACERFKARTAPVDRR